MNYGVPYMGGKNLIAKDIATFLPKAKNFYDLFFGGGGISHAVLVHRNYENMYANDLNPGGYEIFQDAVNGKYIDEKRWISKEDFFLLKEFDPYIKIIWSFGHTGRTYIYAEKLEQMKEAIHRWKLYGDDTLMKELNVDSKMRLQSLERLNRLNKLVGLPRFNEIRFTSMDYKRVDILPDSVVYCDIPYQDKNHYTTYGIEFDHDEFYDWCMKQNELVIISSYTMPDDFVMVWSKPKRQLLRPGGAGQLMEERLFIPKKQLSLFESKMNG